MKKSWSILGLLIVILGLAFILWIKPVSHTAFTEDESISFPVHQLKKESFTHTKNFIGSVQPVQSVNVVPYLSGFLKEVQVSSGEEVKEGQTLFLLDERIPLADLNQAKEAVSQAYAARSNAETYYQRMKNTASKAISSTELEQAKTEFEAADAAYQKSLAAQNQAQTLYDYTVISAPISGWVGNITATVGEYLSPEGKILATIIAFSPIRIMFAVPMSNCHDDLSFNKAKLQVGLADGQYLEFDDFHVMRDNQADKSTDSLSFFIDLPNTDRKLIPGAYTEVRFLYPEKGILVNKNWITLTPNGAEATILKDGIIEKRSVQIGSPLGNQYWIKSGLDEGDQIITVPVSPYQVGQPAKGIVK